jgi:sorbitol-specific phosphotransferase system component IIC
MQPTAATVVVQLVGHGFVVTLTQETPKKRHSKADRKSATHGDILQLNVIGTYFDLTRKITAASTGSTAVARGPISFYDDVYVYVHNLMAVFKSLNSSRELINGTSANGLVRRGKQLY